MKAKVGSLKPGTTFSTCLTNRMGIILQRIGDGSEVSIETFGQPNAELKWLHNDVLVEVAQ